jgi:hypothetical protein
MQTKGIEGLRVIRSTVHVITQRVAERSRRPCHFHRRVMLPQSVGRRSVRGGARSQNRSDGSAHAALGWLDGLFFLFQGTITCGWFLSGPLFASSRLSLSACQAAGFLPFFRFRLSPIQRSASYWARHRHFSLPTPLLTIARRHRVISPLRRLILLS